MSTLIDKLLTDCEGLDLADVGEKKLLREYVLPLCREVCGPDDSLGDDAAVVQFLPGMDVVVSTDRIPTDLLALRMGLMSAKELGAYLVRTSISDIAAMGAQPKTMVISCAFRRDTPVSYVLNLLYGVYSQATAFDCPVVGGDTKSAQEQSLAATVLGVVTSGKAIRRGPVVPGMKLFVSGSIGHFGAALRWFARPEDERKLLAGSSRELMEEGLRARLVAPVPRLDLSDIIVDAGCAAAIDVTDGLIQAIREIVESSGVGAVIDDQKLPFADTTHQVAEFLGLSLRDLIGGIGLDAELVVVSNSNPDPNHFHEFGEISSASGEVRYHDGEIAVRKGFEHFRLDASEYLR